MGMTDLITRDVAADRVPTTPFSKPWLNRLRRALGSEAGKPVLMGGAKISASQQKQINDLRAQLRAWMVEMEDSALHAFDQRGQTDALEQFVQAYRERAAAEVEALKSYEAAQGYRF